MSVRCGRGHFMAEVDDHAFEGYVEGSYFECHAAECVAAEAKAQSDYWATFDVDAFRAALDDESTTRTSDPESR